MSTRLTSGGNNLLDADASNLVAMLGRQLANQQRQDAAAAPRPVLAERRVPVIVQQDEAAMHVQGKKHLAEELVINRHRANWALGETAETMLC